MSGTIPEPPPTSSAGVAAPTRTSRRSGLAPRARRRRTTTSCRNVDTSPSSSRSTVRSISFVPSGGRRDRVRARRRVAVGRGQADHVVLAGPVRRRFGEREAERLRACGLSRTLEHRRRLATAADPATRSVALVALLEPGIAAVVVAVLLPEPGLVVVEQLESRDPLRALPEVEVRDEQPRRPAVLARRAVRRRPPTRPTPSRR